MKEYLVKSSLRILGPFSKEEVVEMIQNHSLSGLDEICTPDHFWKYLRDHIEFQGAINNKNITFDDTFNLTHTLEHTQTAVTNSEVSDTLHQVEATDPSLTDASDIQIESEDVEYLEDGPSAESTAVRLIHKASFKPKQKKKKKSNLGIYATFAVIVTLLVFFSIPEQDKAMKNVKASSPQDLLKEAENEFLLGRNNKSFALYKELIQKVVFKKWDIKHKYYFAVLKIQEKQYLDAQQILQQLEPEAKEKEILVKIKNARALTSMLLQNLETAEEQIRDVLVLDPNNIIAKLNQADLFLLRNDMEMALKTLPPKVVTENLYPTYIFLKSEILWKLFRREQNLNYLLEMQTLMSENFNNLIDIQQALLLLSGLFYYDSGDSNQSKLRFADAILIHPNLFDLHSQEELLYNNYVLYQKLFEWFREFEDDLENLPEFTAAHSIVQYKNNSLLNAQRMIDKAILQKSSDLNFIALQILYTNDESKLQVDNLGLLENPAPLRNVLAGNYCLSQKSYRCARQHFNHLLLIRPHSIEAKYGVAKILFESGNFKDSKRLTNQALGMAPRFIPLKVLENDLNDPEKRL